MPDLSKKRIVIIGGGIAGLAACNRILELVSQSGLEPEIVLLEARDRLGGVIKTRHVEGCLLETGPDAFITQKPWAVELCKRLDIVDQLVNTNPDRRLTMIVKDGRLHGVPDGFMMLAPTRIWPFLRSPVFSIKGKLRMALEYFLPAGKEKVDETLAQFVSRRLGQEALDRIAQPMVGGIYASDPCRLSLKATMPRFLQMEQEHGGVLKALLNMPASNDSGARYSMFVTPINGLSYLVDQLEKRISGQVIIKNSPVSRIDPLDGGRRFRVQTKERALEADAVIIATPANIAALLVKDLSPDLVSSLSKIRFASSAVLNLIFKEGSIKRSLDGFGFVVPAIERLSLMACTFSSIKFPHRAAENMVAMRAFLGGELQSELLDYDDQEITALVLADLDRLLGLAEPPIYAQLDRHHLAMPQYDLGHLQLVEKIESAVSALPGLALCGNSYRGIGIPDCIRSGELAATSIVSYIESLTQSGCTEGIANSGR